MFADRMYTVDAVTARSVILLDEEGHALAMDRFLLPRGVIDGVVVRVPVGTDGGPRWAESTLDSAETNRRRRHSQDLLARLERISGPAAVV